MSDCIYVAEFLQHLFYGHIREVAEGRKKTGKRVSGIHYISANVAAARSVRVVEAQSSKPDCNGVRVAVVEVSCDGMRARRQTTLFPSDWTRAQVLAAIREVYLTRPQCHRGPTWEGRSSAGVYIYLILDGAGRIVTAWPRKQRKKKSGPARRRHTRQWRAVLYAREGLSYDHICRVGYRSA